MNRMRIFLLAALLLSAFAGAVFTGPAVALGETVIAQGLKIQFVDYAKVGDTSTWTYAVTPTSDIKFGLSHITFGVEWTCGYELTAPSTGPYSTPTNVAFCSEPGVSCQSANYQVEVGTDPTTGVSGVKFNSVSNMLEKGNPNTHIFVISLTKTGTHVTGTVPLGLKTGSTNGVLLVAGGTCGSTAVQLSGLSAHSAGKSTFAWVLPAVPLALVWVGLQLRKKNI